MTVDAAEGQSSWRRKSLSRVSSLQPCKMHLLQAVRNGQPQQLAVQGHSAICDVWASGAAATTCGRRLVKQPIGEGSICGSSARAPAWFPRRRASATPQSASHSTFSKIQEWERTFRYFPRVL